MEALQEGEVRALLDALDDEYQAWTTYGQVLADFGEARPFARIRDAEGRHIDALLTLFERYGVPVPPNRWIGKVPRYESLEEACRAAVAAEVANAALYDRLLAATQRADILAVFRNLREASQERHLEAFRRCVSRGEAGRGGRGAGARHRGGRGH
jgi:hypothetical protein